MHHSSRSTLLSPKNRTHHLYGPYSGVYGNTTVIHISARLTPTLVSAQERRELQLQRFSTLLTWTERCGVTDEELELIDMRYQQMLALMNLEDLFAEGQLDCISSA
jgi:hypothetical protein